MTVHPLCCAPAPHKIVDTISRGPRSAVRPRWQRLAAVLPTMLAKDGSS
jgi:hypothetical protein